jgi:RNA polymerase sigma factor (TIGR02999 family)
VEHARARQRLKRGGDALRVTWIEDLAVDQPQGLDLVSLDEALERLSKMDERAARIVELRFFTGLSIEETAQLLGTSTTTVKREWGVARAWLCRELSDAG